MEGVFNLETHTHTHTPCELKLIYHSQNDDMIREPSCRVTSNKATYCTGDCTKRFLDADIKPGTTGPSRLPNPTIPCSPRHTQ